MGDFKTFTDLSFSRIAGSDDYQAVMRFDNAYGVCVTKRHGSSGFEVITFYEEPLLPSVPRTILGSKKHRDRNMVTAIMCKVQNI